ncbi:response regulator transcription factor [Bordetella genomosp. 11]|uniref:response regulator transcription factor n=1 Tax=Bordetella genomosp. 11 TaxID=1416808 RepID=UPI001C3DBA28|nr:DNA-binding response regulator [Bordetella genomosp. 11]
MRYPTISEPRIAPGLDSASLAGSSGAIQSSALPATHRRPCHILIVSDDAINLRATTDFLRNQLFRVTLASGWQGYYHAQAWRPDIILVDGAMHDMDPFMMGRLLMQTPDTQSIPLIFLLDQERQTASREAFSLGAIDCLTKPVYPEELLARISVHLRRTPSRDTTSTQRSHTPAAEELLLRNALNAIAADVGSIHTVRQLARQVGTNERKLSALFKSRMGKSAHKVIFGQKMETARRLLSQTGMPVREVANHVGFRSVCNFSVAFHRDQGITPSGYRRQARAAGNIGATADKDLAGMQDDDDFEQEDQTDA